MTPSIPKKEAERLAALKRYNILDTAPEQTFDDITQLAAFICQTPIATVTLVDENRQWFKARIGVEKTHTPRDDAFCAHTILQSDLMVVPDATLNDRFSDNPLVLEKPGIRFYAGAPLLTHDGHALGSVCVIDHQPRRLAPDQEDALKKLSRLVMSQLEFRAASADLAASVSDVKILSGLLPVCAHCKQVRNDQGYWERVESYLLTHSEATVSHGICPDCRKKMMEEYMKSKGDAATPKTSPGKVN